MGMNTHCRYGAPCERHRTEAEAAADAAEREYRRQAVTYGVPARHEAQMASGVRAAAYQRALERPLTPCSDGRDCEVGW
jgi:hypothetical protein